MRLNGPSLIGLNEFSLKDRLIYWPSLEELGNELIKITNAIAIGLVHLSMTPRYLIFYLTVCNSQLALPTDYPVI
ncbi:hypothetical protein RGQ30_09600 [Limnobacter thiooxidans]|uniref:Uncharacterized protein n=1 Tax=Limnobacter thiooxidans TaxID=131080 RepID=A0AA86IY30_9BURK|nr:hypothetical protein RGQ30_09600 [Limnobacter thiooxidans]